MELLIALGCGAVGLAVMFAALLRPLRLRFARELRRKSRSDLEAMAFHYAHGYFDFIGSGHPDVTLFRELIDRRDVQGLVRNWNRLSRSFLRLERTAGHTGRPLLLDHYNWQEMVFKEVVRRAA